MKVTRMAKDFNPNFKTPVADWCREEHNKANSGGLRGSLFDELRDVKKADIGWEAEQLAKSYGVYLEFDRCKTGQQKDWIYLIRVTIPGGGPITRQAWHIFDEISQRYGLPSGGAGPSLRLTTRQNIQFHWVRKRICWRSYKGWLNPDSTVSTDAATTRAMSWPARYPNIPTSLTPTHGRTGLSGISSCLSNHLFRCLKSTRIMFARVTMKTSLPTGGIC